MAVASIIFDLIGRDRASDPINRVGNSADNAGGKMQKFGKLAKVAALGLAAGAGAAAVGLFKLTQGAAEDAAGQARLAKALQNATGATKAQVAGVEDWISKQGVALGVADDELRPALEKLAVATGDVGKAQKLASLAMDVSAGTGMSLEAVSKALAKAQNGQVAGLSKLGIKTKDAEGKAISFTEAQKRLANAHGGQAATKANTFQGKMDRLKLILAETGETIGAKVLPFVTKMADWFLKKGLPALSLFGGYLSKNLGPVIASLGDWFRSKALPALRQFGQYIGTNLPPLIAKIKPVITDAVNTVRSVLGSLKSIFTSVLGALSALWKTFGGTITSFLRTSLQNTITILRGAFTVVRGIFQTVAALLKGDWRGVWNGIKTILRGAATVIKGVVREMWNRVKTVFKLGGTALKTIMRGAWTGVKTIVRAGITAQVELIRGMPGKLIALAGKMLTAGKTLGGKIIEGLKKGITGIPGVIGNIASAAFDKLKDLINSAIDKINGGIPNSLGKGPLTINLPDNPIPRLARGGPVKKGQPYIVGDRGPRHTWELFVPDEDGRVEARVPSAGGVRPMAAGGASATVVHHHHHTININGAIDPVGTAKHVERIMIQGQRTLGRPFQFKTVPG